MPLHDADGAVDHALRKAVETAAEPMVLVRWLVNHAESDLSARFLTE